MSPTLLVMGFLVSALAQDRVESLRVPVWSPPGQILQAKGLRARVGGEPAAIVRILGPEDDLMVLVVLDLTGDLSKIELAREGLVRAFSGAPPNTVFAVMRAQGGLKVLLDPTGDRAALERVVRGFPVNGKPGLLEVVGPASSLADSILQDAPARIAVLYVSDSEVDGYREDFANPVVNESDEGDLSRRFPEGLVRDRTSRLAAKLTASQSPMFVVHLNYRTGQLDEAYQSGILQMTATTGGTAVFCRSDSEIPVAVESMMRKIAAHYAIDVQVPPGAKGSMLLSLESAAGELAYRSRYDK